MKKMFWTQRTLAVLLVSGCMVLHTWPMAAQDATTNEIGVAVDAATEEVTNATSVAEVEPKHERTRNRGSVVAFFQTAELGRGETAEAVVAIGGSAISRGKVSDAVVAILGNNEVEGEVGDAVVAVLGDVKVTGHVRGEVVAVLGNVTLGENTEVNGEVVAVGGRVIAPASAVIRGKIQELPIGSIPGLGSLQGLRDWFTQCLLKFRLLSLNVGWVWWVALAYFLLYLLVAAALPKAVGACVDEITRRPATTLLMGLLTKLLVPLVMFLLTATGIGLVVVPFVGIALKVAALIGKAALFIYIGRQILRGIASKTMVTPLLALTLGCFVVTLTYMVPVLSLVIYTMTGMWAIGVAMTAAFGGVRREMPQRPLPPAPPQPPMSGTAGFAATTAPSEGTPSMENQASASSEHTLSPAIPEEHAALRAGFWERMGASFLDIILVSILASIVQKPFVSFLIALAYFSAMWAWKGTTVGGIVLNLKVVRYDGKPMGFAVALVRSLAAAFSAVVLFLGFFWIAWDDEKQGWHDKIAGTHVVRIPRGTPLVCL